MSEFFNFQDEKGQSRFSKFIEDNSSEDELKMRNKDKKLEELHSVVDNLKPKDLEAFVKNIKKYKNLFKNGLPPFLLKFFEENMKTCNKALVAKIKRIIEQHRSTDDFELKVVENKKSDENFQEKLNALLKEKNVLVKLDGLYLKSATVERMRINFVKFGIFNQEIANKNFKNYDLYSKLILDMLNLISNSESDCIKNELGNFSKNLPFFLNRLMLILDPGKFDDFESLLSKLENSGYEIEHPKLEFYYFYKKQNVETNDNQYKLLFFIRNCDYNSAKGHYSSNHLQNIDIDDRILYEMGISAFKNGDWIFAFDIFDRIKTIETNLLKMSLCAILGSELKERDFFQNKFLQKVKTFENKNLLRSVNPENELIRMFFLLNKYRVREASDILRRYLKIDIFSHLTQHALIKLGDDN